MTAETENSEPPQEEALIILNTIRLGKSILRLTQVDSTNAYAAGLAKEGAREGTVIIAGMQNAGYGRMNRHWVSPKGGLWLSIILRPNIAPKDAPVLTLMGACAVVKTLKSTLGLDAKIKWPNDVLISGKKVCGILTEMRTLENGIDFVILGLGINANFQVTEIPKDMRNTATTLTAECGEDISVGEVLRSLIVDIDCLYDTLLSQGSESIIEMWKRTSDTLGQHVRITAVKDSIEGTAVDVDGSGALIVKTGDGEFKTILAGDCMYLSKTE
jgi:BirA family biotin operon repressor/biotin-[acetyl-CoA-carboxylase] ligase